MSIRLYIPRFMDKINLCAQNLNAKEFVPGMSSMPPMESDEQFMMGNQGLKVDIKQIDDEGNAFGKALMAAKKNGEKEFVVGGKKYNVEAEMDKVNPVAVKKKFKDRKDKDIDNDGDVDASDRYLHKRRKAISKEID